MTVHFQFDYFIKAYGFGYFHTIRINLVTDHFRVSWFLFFYFIGIFDINLYIYLEHTFFNSV